MQPQKPFRSHAFCKPRYLDGQGDELAGKEPAWKGTVASRIRSLNDMTNPASTGQAPTRSAQDLCEEAMPSTRPMLASSLTPVRSDESHGSGSLSGRTNPFVRRSPPRTLHTPSKPSLPQRISHSDVPVKAPVPSVLIQRPTFFEDQSRVAQQPTARETRSSELDTGSRQAFGRQPMGNHLRGAELTSPGPTAGSGRGHARTPSPTGTRATAKRFEELESRRKTTAGGLERGLKEDAVMVDRNQRTQLAVTSPSVITARKSQPELRSKDMPTPSVPETERNPRHGLTIQKASLPDYARSTSPSIGIGSRTTTPFGRAGWVRSVSPNESGHAKSDRIGRNHAWLERIDSIILDIDTTSTSIESTAREITAVAHAIGLLSSPSTITTNEAISTDSRVSGAEPQAQADLQGQTLQADVSSSAARMRRNTQDGTPSQDASGASPAPDVIDSIDSILAEHDAVVDNVIEQLQACGHRLQTIRSLSQQFGSIPIPSSSGVGEKGAGSDSASSPTASINDSPALQRQRMRSIPDLVHLVDDAGEVFGLNPKQAEDEQLKGPTEEVYHANSEHEPRAFPARRDPIAPGELQSLLSKTIIIPPAELPAQLVPSTPSMPPRLSTRYFDVGTFPRNGILASARSSTPTPPPSPPHPLDDVPMRRTRIRLHTTLPIPETPPSSHAERYGSPLQGRTSNPSSPCAGSATRLSPVQRHHHRQPSSYLSAKRGIDSPTTCAGPTIASVLDSIRPTPTVYFPYQHLPSARASAQAASSTHEELQPGNDCPLFPTRGDDPRGPITRAPETPPPPPPLFSMDPEEELELGGYGFPRALSPETTDYWPSTADMARAATCAALEREHKHLTNLTALTMPIPIIGQRPVATNIPSENKKELPAASSPTKSTRRDNSPSVPGRRSTSSTGSSGSRRLPYTQQTPFSSSENASTSLKQPKPPPRRTTNIQKVQSPTSFLSISTSTSVLFGPESPLVIQISPSYSPATMATLAAATHNHPTNQRLPPTPAPLAYPLPSPTGPPLHSVHRLTSSPKTEPAAVAAAVTKKDSVDAKGNEEDDDSTPVVAGMATATAGQKQEEQNQVVSASSAFLNTSTITALPMPIAIQQPSSDASAPVSNTVSPSPSVCPSSPSPSPSPPPPPQQQQPQSLQHCDDDAGSKRSSDYNDDDGRHNDASRPQPQPLQPLQPNSTPTAQEGGSEREPREAPPPPPNSYHYRHLHHHRHHYPPFNVPDRVRMLEEARKERIRILRATGQHWDTVGTFSGDFGVVEGFPGSFGGAAGGEDGGGDGDGDTARTLMLLLGGPREQIGALKAPWW